MAPHSPPLKEEGSEPEAMALSKVDLTTPRAYIQIIRVANLGPWKGFGFWGKLEAGERPLVCEN